MTDLSDAALHELAGGDVATVAAAQDVPVVTAAEVEAARQAADEAERAAAESERKAVLGEVGHGQAVSDREAARFARLRLSLTQRKAERHQKAQRLRALAEAGSDALSHAEGLAELRDQTGADLAAIDALHAGIAKRVSDWNGGLAAIMERIAALEPEPLLPGGEPRPSSAGVWGATTDRLPHVVTGGRVITGINVEDTRGLPAAIDAASRPARRGDPAARLIVGANGIVVPMGRDEYGHFQRQIDEGKLRELTLAEKWAYYRGEAVTHG